jgi:hypothetical protein
MSNIDDLRKSITEMTTEELREQFLILRQARRTPIKTSSSTKKASISRQTTNQKLADLLDQISDPDILEKLLERMI